MKRPLKSIYLSLLLVWSSSLAATDAAAATNDVEEDFEEAEEGEKLTALFVNELPHDTIDLYWENQSIDEDHPERRRYTGRIPPRGSYFSTETYSGHEFSYDLGGKRHYVTPKNSNSFGEQFIIIAGDHDDVRVRCEIAGSPSQSYSDYFDVVVKPYWAPRAVSRYLELVRMKYYDGSAMNRVVPRFITQFGIAKDYAVRTQEREKMIWDDFGVGIRFDAGFISFAGFGPDSRTTEVFVVMPGVTQDHLDHLGDNPWEVPFGYVENIESSALSRIYDGYDEIPPWGTGPDSAKIFEADGYTSYLPNDFPKLDYIERCFIVEEVGDFTEGEF